MKNQTVEKIQELTRQVRLPGVRKYLAEEITEANLKNVPYEDFLYHLLLKEYDLRQESGKKNRIRLAGFPQRKYLEDLSINDLPPDAQKRLKVLKSLDFIAQGQNVILAGSPGTGKTHLAIGLGIKACLSGYRSCL
jgi:DNA replication protein DnaC